MSASEAGGGGCVVAVVVFLLPAVAWGSIAVERVSSGLALLGRDSAARDSRTAEGRFRLSVTTVLGRVSGKTSFCASGLKRACS